MRRLKTKVLPKMAVKDFIEAKLTQGMYDVGYIDDGDSLQITIVKTGDVIEHAPDDAE